MGRQKEYKKIDIDVEPFLSIMAIVMKLISLILVVIVMRIAMNPNLKKIVALQGLWSGSGNIVDAKEPRYLDCYPDKVIIYPHAITNTWADLQRPDNAIEQMLDRMDSSNEYVVIMARPQSVKYFRAVRKMVRDRPKIDVGYDAVSANFRVDWDEARKALSVKEDEDTNAPAAVVAPATRPATR